MWCYGWRWPVSYTHLDVYKRQAFAFCKTSGETSESGEFFLYSTCNGMKSVPGTASLAAQTVANSCLLYTSRKRLAGSHESCSRSNQDTM